MSKGRRYDREAKLNYKKVFAVIIAIIVIIIAIIAIKKLFTKAKNTKTIEKNVNYIVDGNPNLSWRVIKFIFVFLNIK